MPNILVVPGDGEMKFRLKNGEIVSCLNIETSAFKILLKLVTEVEGILQRDLFDIPHGLADNYRDKRMGVSFISQNLQRLDSIMKEALIGFWDQMLVRKVLDIYAVKVLLKDLYDLGPMLLILFHLVYGNPTRSTELAKVSWKNGSEIRSIFLDGQVFCIAIRYKKVFKRFRNAKPVYRFLPENVSRLLFNYLLCIYILEKAETSLKAPDEVTVVNYLILKDYPPKALPELFVECFTASTGITILFSKYRHLVALLLRTLFVDMSKLKQLDVLIAKQAGRTSCIYTTAYQMQPAQGPILWTRSLLKYFLNCGT